MNNKENQSLGNNKILVVGVPINSKGVISYLWEKLPEDLNFADFNIVIMDMTRFEDRNFIDVLPNYNLIKKSNFENFLFFKKNELIVIGYPFCYTKPAEVGSGRMVFEFADQFPYYPPFIDACGDGIEKVNKEFEFYFKNVKKWKKHLKSNSFSYEFKLTEIPDFIKNNFKVASEFKSFICITPIALTLSQHPIAFSFTSSFLFIEHRLMSDQPGNVCTAKVINLSPTTTVSAETAIKSILVNRYKMTLELSFPVWLNKYKTSIQEKIESNLISLFKKKLDIEREIEDQNQYLKNEIKFQKLLFEQGTELQIIVYDALALLGAEVDRIDKKEDDGKIIAPNGKKGILEIKGKSKSIARDDIRQLDDWKDVLEIKDSIERKGILIANCFIGEPISERNQYFPDDCIKKAKANEFCLLKSSQLFKAICSFKEDKLNIKDFWDEVFATNGVCKLDDL
jgi:hypothetical protein